MHHIHRHISPFLISVLFLGCANSQVHQDFPFQDSGKREYRATTLHADLTKHFGHPFPKIKVLLIETPTLANASFIKQNETFKSIGHAIEEMQVMFVVACPTEEYLGGYHTTKETATALAKERPIFRLTLLSANRQILKTTTAPLDSKELHKWVQG